MVCSARYGSSLLNRKARAHDGRKVAQALSDSFPSKNGNRTVSNKDPLDLPHLRERFGTRGANGNTTGNRDIVPDASFLASIHP